MGLESRIRLSTRDPTSPPLKSKATHIIISIFRLGCCRYPIQWGWQHQTTASLFCRSTPARPHSSISVLTHSDHAFLIRHILSRYLNLWTFWKLKIFSKLKFSNSITNIHKKHYRFISMKCSPKLLINTIMELDNNRLKFFINIQLEPILDGNA